MNAVTDLYRELHRRVVERLTVRVEGCCGGPECGFPDPAEPFWVYERIAQIARSSGWLGLNNEVRLDELCLEIERRDAVIAHQGEAIAALQKQLAVLTRHATGMDLAWLDQHPEPYGPQTGVAKLIDIVEATPPAEIVTVGR